MKGLQGPVKLYFKASDKNEIYINAICEGFNISEKKLKIRWECHRYNIDSLLIMQSSKEVYISDKSPFIVIKIPDSLLGYKYEIKATVYYEDDYANGVDVKKSLTIYPDITPRSISKVAPWFYMKSGKWYELQDKL